MSDPLAAPPSGEEGLAARSVRALLERHGLPRYRHSAWLADATGLSYSQAHRRMTGASAWTLEDLERVGAIFGESLSQMIAFAGDQPSLGGALRIGTSDMPCRLWLGEPVERPRPGELVAREVEGRWLAVPASEAGPGPVYRVDRIDLRPADAVRRVVAVLDDDRDLARSVAAHLETVGYDARPFFRAIDLEASLETTAYDAYVIDWIVGESSVEKLIATLRERDPGAPIVTLTAQVLTGVVAESDIASAVSRYNLLFSEKPVRMSILSATLARAFATPPSPAPT